MYFTDESLLSENQEPLIITAVPMGPMWALSDFPADIPVTCDEQVDARLLSCARAATPGYPAVAVGLGLTGTVLTLAQARLLAHALATAPRGSRTARWA